VDEPEVEEFDPQEWKLLFMLLAENRGGINFYQHLTPYGVAMLDSVRRKLGVRVVGVEIGTTRELPVAYHCEECGEPVLYKRELHVEER
jgi:hypothetical protein